MNNICRCTSKFGISVLQPEYQILPNDTIVINPSFIKDLNKSFWTYEFFIDCDLKTKTISEFVIPISQIISTENIVIYEKIDGHCNFKRIPFALIKDDITFGTAPESFKFLKIETKNRYEKGVCIKYLLEIIGDFSPSTQAIKIRTKNSFIPLIFESRFSVPKCSPKGKLLIFKKCNNVIIDNQAVLKYNIYINNIGNTPLNSVLLQDIISIPTQLSIGKIKMNITTLNVNTSTPGEVIISGNLGNINPGQQISITYSIPIIKVSAPGKYLIYNTANVLSKGTKDSSNCTTTLNVVKLNAKKSCKIDKNKATYTLTISNVEESPDVLVDIYDSMIIPLGVTIQFKNLNGGQAYFYNTTNPISINTNIDGPANIDITYKSVTIPQYCSYKKRISYILISSSMEGTSTITNNLINILPVNPSDQIFLEVSNIPTSYDINIQLIQVCKKTNL